MSVIIKNTVDKLGDIEGNPFKYAHRGYETGMINHYFPNGIPKDQIIVTLAGRYTDKKGKLISGSEIEYFLKIAKIPAKQIVCVDIDKAVIDTNNKNVDPICKGIRNVYAPVRIIDEEKNKVGGIEKAIYDLIKDGEKIAVVSADLMGVVRTLVPSVAGILSWLGCQKEQAVVMFNFSAFDRHPEYNDFHEPEIGHGNYDVLEAFLKEKTASSSITENKTIKKAMRSTFKLVVKRTFDYVGGKGTPMSALTLIKPKTRKGKELPMRKTKAELTRIAKKAWKTRKANAKKNGKLSPQQRAWVTRRKNEGKLSPQERAWVTRRANTKKKKVA